MKTNHAGLLSGFCFVLSISVGVVFFGDRFMNGFVALLFVFVCGIVWPLSVAHQLSVRRQKAELIRALVRENRWAQDAVLEELDESTRGEFLRRLGRDDS